MDNFVVLTNRKRAVIALVHSVAFLLLACFTSLRTVAPFSLHGGRLASGLLMLLMYGSVTTILLYLTRLSICMKERLYFGLCSTSAGTALLRTVVGDHAMHGAQYLRVILLMCAVLVGTAIMKSHSPDVVPSEVLVSD